MNISLTIRYFTELAMVIPAAAMAVIPVYRCRRVNKAFLFGALATVLGIFTVGGSILCSMLLIPTNKLLFPTMVAMFLLYNFCFELSIFQKLFSFGNSMFLCAFSTTYNTFLTAPLELGNKYNVYNLSSGLICLGVTVSVGLVFARTLFKKFPEMFENEDLDNVWKVLSIVQLTASVLIIWTNPLSAENVMIGRLRRITLVIFLTIPIVTLFLYHILWWLSKKMTERADLQRSLDFFRMEENQYRKTRQYLQESSQLRHDFRQHILLINEYLKKGQTCKLNEYLAPLVEHISQRHKAICENQAVDAIASHYDEAAKSQDVSINWSIDLGEDLPVKESDMCAVMGNLVENAIRAASELDGDNRLVSVRIGLMNPKALVISIYNAYRGRIELDKNDLPITNKEGHGIGLRSVQNIVKRYKGSMVIETHNGIFNVSILMYRPE
ncbi:MAG: GHKL domain-containing protein [Ruminococcus sp.]|uniref:sensor histidine kinase n=1 Tax=Ruminococcus sp. TaxID=41978 RepID=UPI0025ECFAD5|nr:GHKL domain-containing protein [Ruminococcus sp.]MCR5541538.1 GHKL domain-containing protein [Ruminococcus sp.]